MNYRLKCQNQENTLIIDIRLAAKNGVTNDINPNCNGALDALLDTGERMN